MTFDPTLSYQLNNLAALASRNAVTGNPGGYLSPQAGHLGHGQQPVNQSNMGMASLESAVANLSTNVMYLSQQISMLAVELHRQSAQSSSQTTSQSNVGFITQQHAGPSVDEAQNARLASLDAKVKSLTALVAAYNRQLSSLIAIYRNSRSQAVTQYADQHDHSFEGGWGNTQMGPAQPGYVGSASNY